MLFPARSLQNSPSTQNYTLEASHNILEFARNKCKPICVLSYVYQLIRIGRIRKKLFAKKEHLTNFLNLIPRLIYKTLSLNKTSGKNTTGKKHEKIPVV